MKKQIKKTFLLITFVCLIAIIAVGCGPAPAKGDTYNITYDTLNGILSSKQNTYNSEEGLTLPIPTRENYVFEGWYENANYSGNPVTKIAKGTTGDKKFYAKWKLGEQAGRTYDIKYILNGGKIDASVDLTYSDDAEVALPVPTKEFATFEGWYETSQFTGEAVTKIEKGSSGVKKFYAKWTQNELPAIYRTITYILNGGEYKANTYVPEIYEVGKQIILPSGDDVDFGNYIFAGWYTEADFSGEEVMVITKETEANLVLYAKWDEPVNKYQPRWNLNSIGYKGNGEDVVILVNPLEEYDPYNTGYNLDDKAIKQYHLSDVNSAYNVKVKYEQYDASAPWGPDRVTHIKDNQKDGTFSKKNIYVVSITSQWVPTLVRANALAPLYDNTTKSGLFKEVGYEQDPVISQSMTDNKKVYGYSTGIARPDYFMYYNVDLAKASKLADPAELWLQGKWTWTTFEQWVKQAQTNLTGGTFKNVIDVGAAPFFIGAANAQGYPLINSNGNVLFSKTNQVNIFKKMADLYEGGYWNTAHGGNDVTGLFLNGQTVFANGDLWFLKASNRFDPSKVKFKIGIVPYPTRDGELMTPYTEPYDYYDSQGNLVHVSNPILREDGTPLKDDGGNDIYGLNIDSKAKFRIPYTGVANYSILNFKQTASGLTSSIVFHILYDLVSGLGEDPDKTVKLTADEAYRASIARKLDRDIDADVIMSVQDGQLVYELMEVVSMTAGGASHYGANGWWAQGPAIIKTPNNVKAALDALVPPYEEAVRDLGIA